MKFGEVLSEGNLDWILSTFDIIVEIFVYILVIPFHRCHIKPCFELVQVVCPGRSFFLLFIFDKCIGTCGRTLDHSIDISTSPQSHGHSLLLQPNKNTLNMVMGVVKCVV